MFCIRKEAKLMEWPVEISDQCAVERMLASSENIKTTSVIFNLNLKWSVLECISKSVRFKRAIKKKTLFNIKEILEFGRLNG